jgi:hypothetical protein
MNLRSKSFSAVFFCFCCIPALAEQIELKNGTKFSGTSIAVQGDMFRVKTAYGEMEVPRSDLATISFPKADSADAITEKQFAPVDETLSGTNYVNRTGGFELTVPEGWVLGPELRKKQPDIVAALKSADQSQFVVVTPERFAGNLTTYEVFCETQYQAKFQDYKRMEKSDIKLDGRPGIRMIFQGVSSVNHVSLKFLVYILQYEDKMIRLTFFTLEPLFADSLPVFEKIAGTYRLHKPVSVASMGLPRVLGRHQVPVLRRAQWYHAQSPLPN